MNRGKIRQSSSTDFLNKKKPFSYIKYYDIKHIIKKKDDIFFDKELKLNKIISEIKKKNREKYKIMYSKRENNRKMILDSFRKRKNLGQLKQYDIKYDYIEKHIPYPRLDSNTSRFDNNNYEKNFKEKLGKNQIRVIYKNYHLNE